MRFALTILILWWLAMPSRAAEMTDTIRTKLADEAVLSYSFTTEAALATVHFSSEFYLSNPTTFYPDSVRISGAEARGTQLYRLSDSVYLIESILTANAGASVSVDVFGEALMANSDTSRLSFAGVNLGSIVLPPKSYLLIVGSDYSEMPYYRYPRFISVFPSPCTAGTSLKWRVLIDHPDRIEFYLMNLVGAMDLLTEVQITTPGVLDFECEVPEFHPAGLHYLILKSKFGFNQYKIEIVK